MSAVRHSLHLAGESGDPSAARSFVRDVVAARGGLGDGHADDLQLMVSELVTNAYLYAPGPITLVIELEPVRMRVVVRDCSPEAPAVGTLDDPHAVTGRGLGIVERLAASWGVDFHPDGKSVWFTLHLT